MPLNDLDSNQFDISAAVTAATPRPRPGDPIAITPQLTRQYMDEMVRHLESGVMRDLAREAEMERHRANQVRTMQSWQTQVQGSILDMAYPSSGPGLLRGRDLPREIFGFPVIYDERPGRDNWETIIMARCKDRYVSMSLSRDTIRQGGGPFITVAVNELYKTLERDFMQNEVVNRVHVEAERSWKRATRKSKSLMDSKPRSLILGE